MENREINLNREQKAAVTHTEGPLLVIAGPGSGKTRTLVERVVHMLTEKEISPEKIMVSTFTDRVCKLKSPFFKWFSRKEKVPGAYSPLSIKV